ncbi:MAG: hypothetical protein PHS44_02535 [Candidatus Dojkabacteria bacterium]|jgi:energy-coupling factor transporter transmembrane protein EcfT|nr:hypothetical protein [Candidatus Dojkabacteria bacterium]
MENFETIDIPFPLFIAIIVVATSIVFFLTAAIIHLSRKIKVLSKMRYGFGGKPIFSILVFLFVVISIPLTLLASSRSIDLIQKASVSKDVLIEVQDLGTKNNYHEVAFLAIPYVDDIAWAGNVYTVTWEIRGNIDYEKIEENVSSSNPSYFKKTLAAGTYKVKVLVEGDDFRVQKFEDFILE